VTGAGGAPGDTSVFVMKQFTHNTLYSNFQNIKEERGKDQRGKSVRLEEQKKKTPQKTTEKASCHLFLLDYSPSSGSIRQVRGNK